MNAENNARNIQTLDRSVTSVERFGEPEKLQELKDRYYYVYHFIKEPDSALQQTSRFDLSQEYLAPYILEYRHYRKRYDIWKQALEIIKFREWYPSSASRVRGIDACSQEIGCCLLYTSCQMRHTVKLRWNLRFWSTWFPKFGRILYWMPNASKKYVNCTLPTTCIPFFNTSELSVSFGWGRPSMRISASAKLRRNM